MMIAMIAHKIVLVNDSIEFIFDFPEGKIKPEFQIQNGRGDPEPEHCV